MTGLRMYMNFPSARMRISLLATTIVLCMSACIGPAISSTPLPTSAIEGLCAIARPASDYGLLLDSRGFAHRNAPLQEEASGLQVEIPMLSDRHDRIGHILIEVRVNGEKALALVDTGSPFSIVSYRLAHAARLVPVRGAKGEVPEAGGLHMRPLSGLGGEATRIAAVAAEISLGDKLIENIPLWILNQRGGLGAIEWIGFSRVDMIMGNDMLSLFRRAVFDYENDSLILSNRPGEPGESMSEIDCVALFRTRPIPIALGCIADNPPIPIVIDTGSDSGLWVPARMSKQLKLLDYGLGPDQSYGRGFGGRTVYRDIAPHALSFDNITIRNILVTVELVPQTDNGPRFVLLGQRVLRRFKVTLDYAASRLMLERIE